MENKTAIQELIYWLKSGWKDEDIDTVIKKAKQLLEVEKEQIKDAWLCGQTNGATICTPDAYEPKEKYYNETYNKDNDN